MKGIGVALLALGCVVVGALGAWLGVIPPMIGLSLYFAGGALGLVALVWGVIAKLKKKRRDGVLIAGVGALPFLLVAATAGGMVGKGGPGINDITTDSGDAPMFAKSTMHGDYPSEFVEKAAQAYPKVQALELAIEPTAAVALALKVAKSRSWTIVDTRSDGFEAFERSRLFRFRDDVVVRIRPQAGGGSRVDIRSASRDGKADFGVNAERIESFLEDVGKRARPVAP
jgi:uncharacterized protein (DUF1499 family)